MEEYKEFECSRVWKEWQNPDIDLDEALNQLEEICKQLNGIGFCLESSPEKLSNNYLFPQHSSAVHLSVFNNPVGLVSKTVIVYDKDNKEPTELINAFADFYSSQYQGNDSE